MCEYSQSGVKCFVSYSVTRLRCSSLNDLDDMSDGLRRLKNLGLGLQSEIEDQDDSIDSLLNKVDKMDCKIINTNNQIKNLK